MKPKQAKTPPKPRAVRRRTRSGAAAAAKQMVLRHLGSGKYSDVFKVTAGKAKPVVMKVSYYRDDTLCSFVRRAKQGDLRGALRAKSQDAIQVSNTFAKLTATLLDSVSPHFVVVFCDQDCKAFAPRLGALLRERLQKLTPLQKRFNNVCFMEVFHNNLTNFLVGGRYDEATLRGLVFQVLYTAAALQKLLPGFRHNDLSTNNVLIKRLRARPLLSYAFDGQTYHVAVPFLVALSDYDFVHVPGNPALSNERVMNGRYKVDGRRNDSYDTHFFLKSVLKCIQRRAEEFPQTMEFLKRLRMREEDRQNNAVFARLRPAALLKDPYFAPLTEKPEGHVVAAYAA